MRALFLVRIGETENVESQEKAELRQNLLKAAEEVMRGSLRRLQFAEEVSYLKSELAEAKMREVDRDEEKISELAE